MEKTLSKEVGRKGKGAPRNRRGSRNTRTQGFQFRLRRAQRVAKTRRGRQFREKKATVSFLCRAILGPTIVSASPLPRECCNDDTVVTLWKKRWKVEVTLLKLKYNNNNNNEKYILHISYCMIKSNLYNNIIKIQISGKIYFYKFLFDISKCEVIYR